MTWEYQYHVYPNPSKCRNQSKMIIQKRETVSHQPQPIVSIVCPHTQARIITQSSQVLCFNIPNRLINRATTKNVASTNVMVVTTNTDRPREGITLSRSSIATVAVAVFEVGEAEDQVMVVVESRSKSKPLRYIPSPSKSNSHRLLYLFLCLYFASAPRECSGSRG